MPILLKYLLLASVPGLMFCIIPVEGTAFRFSWQMAALWMGAAAFTALLSSFWFRSFWLCALLVTVIQAWPPNYEAYLSLLTVAVFLSAVEGFSRIDPRATLYAMRLAAFVLLAWMFLQETGLVRSWFTSRNNAGPFNPNTGGVFLALCLPAFLTSWWWAAAPLVVLGIACTKCTTAMLAATAAMLTWWFISQRGPKSALKSVPFASPAIRKTAVIFVFLAVVMMPVVWFAKIDSLGGIMKADRWIAWKHAAMSMQTEMYGRGLGSWREVFPLLASGVPELNTVVRTQDGRQATEVFMQAHNEYVQAAFELGIQTLALIIAYLLTVSGKIYAAKTGATPIPAAGLVALAVSCGGFFTFHVAPTALLGAAWLGMVEGHFKEA
jgi:hypothetical protein